MGLLTTLQMITLQVSSKTKHKAKHSEKDVRAKLIRNQRYDSKVLTLSEVWQY